MYADPYGLMQLPSDPSGLPSDWTPDTTHKDPNGERFKHPNGDQLDFHKGREGKPGWRGKDHWHHNGGSEHLPPGSEVPDPETEQSCGENCQKTAIVVAGTGGAYLAYRCLRMIPSFFPPLWPTIPANATIP